MKLNTSLSTCTSFSVKVKQYLCYFSDKIICACVQDRDREKEGFKVAINLIFISSLQKSYGKSTPLPANPPTLVFLPIRAGRGSGMCNKKSDQSFGFCLSHFSFINTSEFNSWTSLINLLVPWYLLSQLIWILNFFLFQIGFKRIKNCFNI
jgi:hypothetical protein